MNRHFFYPYTLIFKVLWSRLLTFRNKSIELVAVNLMFPIADLIQKKSPGDISLKQLSELPDDSFGHALFLHMTKHKLQFIKGFEEHDMKHLILNYEVTVPGEIRLSAFEFGAGNRSFMTLGVFFLGIPLAADLWKDMIRDYKQGRKHPEFKKLNLKRHLNTNFKILMERTPKSPG